jgi:hypothetical protein
MRSASAMLLSLALATSVSTAQPVALATLAATPALELDDKLRLRNGPRTVTGRLASASGDTLRLRLAPLRWTVAAPLTIESNLYRSTGPDSRVKGALRGALFGAIGGVLVGITISEAFDAPVRDGVAISQFFLPYTLPLGAVVGALLPGDRWERITLAAQEVHSADATFTPRDPDFARGAARRATCDDPAPDPDAARDRALVRTGPPAHCGHH